MITDIPAMVTLMSSVSIMISANTMTRVNITMIGINNPIVQHGDTFHPVGFPWQDERGFLSLSDAPVNCRLFTRLRTLHNQLSLYFPQQ
jgi:hypothetical protein